MQILICKSETMEKCFFRDALQCSEDLGNLTTVGCAWIEKIIECSKVYDDDIHTVLAVKLTDDSSLTSAIETVRQHTRLNNKLRDFCSEGWCGNWTLCSTKVWKKFVWFKPPFCSSVYFVEVIVREEPRALAKSLQIRTEWKCPFKKQFIYFMWTIFCIVCDLHILMAGVCLGWSSTWLYWDGWCSAVLAQLLVAFL